MVELSHACVFDIESEELEIIKIGEFVKFYPRTFKDFNQYEGYFVKDGPRRYKDVEILALGDSVNMENFMNVSKSVSITHVAVQSLENNQFLLVEIDDIHEFKNFVPAYKTRYDPNGFYSMDCDRGEGPRISINIHSLGDITEAKEILGQLLNPPSHALIRTLDRDAITIVSMDEIVKKNGWLFQHENDYDEFRDYQITQINDTKPKVVQVQILKIGQLQDCQNKMQEFMTISHVLVRLVKTDRKKIVDLKKIPEIAAVNPETGREFDADRLYKYETSGGPKAVQVYLMGQKNILIFECLQHSGKRFKKTKFSNSDVELIESHNIALKGAKNDSSKKKPQNNLTNRCSLIKRQKALKNKKSIVDQSPRHSDDEHAHDGRVLSDCNDKDSDINNNWHTLSPRRTPRVTYKTARKDLFPPQRDASGDSMGDGDNSVIHKALSRSSKHQHVPSARKTSRHLKRKPREVNQPESRTKKVRQSRNDSDEFYDNYWSDDSIGETDEFCVFQEWTEYGSEDSTQLSIDALKKKEYFMKSVTGKERTEVTPSKMRSIYQCLKYWVRFYHEDWLYSQSLRSYTDQIEAWLGQEIAYQMKQHQDGMSSNKEKRRKTSWREALN